MKSILIAVLYIASLANAAKYCNTNQNPVCGSNGITYRNECFFNNDIEFDSSLTMAHYGSCLNEYNPDDGTLCMWVELPVCGSNGYTYSNKCWFSKAKSIHPSLRILYNSACESIMRRSKVLICASNGRFYEPEIFYSMEKLHGITRMPDSFCNWINHGTV